MNEERLTALSLAIETGTDMHFDKEELEWLIAAARERDALQRMRVLDQDRQHTLWRALRTIADGPYEDASRIALEAIQTQQDEILPAFDTLTAQVARLRQWIVIMLDAYKRGRDFDVFGVEQTLEETPKASQYRDSVLEEAAKVADKYYPTDDEIKEQGGCTQGQSMVRSVAHAIRAMKADT